MKDILPHEISGWHFLESKLSCLFSQYGYLEIRMPIVEQTELFKRAIGEVTDIVEKEMYTFLDKNGDQLTLRPEGTAQVVRSAIENSLLRSKSQRLWYQGPMFRRENPQKGRYRQFTQYGVEAFGLEGPDIDAEQIVMMARGWKQLGLGATLTLQLNTLGTMQERQVYKATLVKYFKRHQALLDEESQRRLLTNPLRILDSKNPAMQPLLREAPALLDFLGEDSLRYFETLQKFLKQAGISFELNSRLVRGLDYYTHVVYEWVTEELGSQGTVCAGGRYNDLVAQIGGQPTPGVGFSIGIERLLMLLQEHQLLPPVRALDIYIVAVGEAAKEKALSVAEELREALPFMRILMHCGPGNFKNQFKSADKSGARFAVILGEQELEENKMSIKTLRDTSPQTLFTFDEAVTYLQQA